MWQSVINLKNRYNFVFYFISGILFHIIVLLILGWIFQNRNIFANDSESAVSMTTEYILHGMNETDVSVTTYNTSADNVTYYSNSTITYNFSINNTGYARAYDINVSMASLDNWTINGSDFNISLLLKNTSCYGNITITIPNGTPKGLHYINFTLRWRNLDNSTGYNISLHELWIASNPIIDVDGDNITDLSSQGYNVVNMTVRSMGNDNVTNVTFNCTGFVCSDFNVSFSPNNVTVMGPGDAVEVNITYFVPIGYEIGTYNGTIIVNATEAGETETVTIIDDELLPVVTL